MRTRTRLVVICSVLSFVAGAAVSAAVFLLTANDTTTEVAEAETVNDQFVVATTTTTTPTTTTAPELQRCADEFAQELSAYGWERCLLGNFNVVYIKDEQDGRNFLGRVWRKYGSGQRPEYHTNPNAVAEFCGRQSEGCAWEDEREGRRGIAMLKPVRKRDLLHEIAHHLRGFDDNRYGGHGMDFRCAAVYLYRDYLPEAVSEDDLAALLEEC